MPSQDKEEKKVYPPSPNDGFFEKVPDPIISKIVSFSKPANIAKLARVNHRIHDIIEETSYPKWRDMNNELKPLIKKVTEAEKKIKYIEIATGTKKEISECQRLGHTLGFILYVLTPGIGAGGLVTYLLTNTLGPGLALGIGIGVSLPLSFPIWALVFLL